MKTFVMMTKLAPQDAHLVEVGAKLQTHDRNSRAWLEEVKSKCPDVQFKAHYALLGYWDFMDIYEAPSEEVAAIVSLISRSRGAYLVENWSAISYERLLELSKEINAT